MKTTACFMVLFALAFLGGCNKANSGNTNPHPRVITSPSAVSPSPSGAAVASSSPIQLRYSGFENGLVRKTDYDPEGNRILVGNPQGGQIVHPKQQMMLAKQNQAGDELWNVCWQTESLVQALSLLVDTDGGIYIAGMTGNPGDDTDFLLLKYSASGELLWEKAWGNTYAEMLQVLTVDAEHNIYAAGVSFARDRSLSGSSPILKLSSTGEVLARSGINTGSATTVTSLAMEGENVYVAAGVKVGERRKQAGLILSLSNDLSLQWGLSLVDEDSITSTQIFMNAAGDLLVVGNVSRRNPNMARNIFSIVVSKQGEVLSATEYQGAFDDVLNGAFQAADSTIYCYCQRSTGSGETRDTDFLVVGFGGSGEDPVAYTLDSGEQTAKPRGIAENPAGGLELFTDSPFEANTQWQETTLSGSKFECEVSAADVVMEAVEIQTYTPDSIRKKRLK